MKKNQFRKSFVIFLVFVMMFNMSVFAGSNNYFEVSGSKATSGDINVGDVFIYDLTIKAKEAGVNDVKVQVSGDVSLVSGSEFDFGTALTTGTTKSLALKNTGSGNRLNMYIYRTSDSGKAIVENVTIDGLISSGGGSTTVTDKNKYFPDFSIQLGTKTPVFTAGQVKDFAINLENISDYSSKNTTLKLELAQDSPFDDSQYSLISKKMSISKKTSKEIVFQVDTKASAKSGFYTIPVKITYQNVYGIEKTMNKSFQVEVVNNNTLPSLVISDMKIKNALLTPGTSDVMLLELKNLGSIDVRSLNASLEGLKMDGITLNGDSAEKQLSSIEAKDTGFLTYNVNISDKLKDEDVELKLKLSYYDEYGTKYEQDVPVYLDILQQGGDLYDLGFKVTSKPNTVVPESEFKLAFEITNDTPVVQDLKINMTSESGLVFKTQPITVVKELQPDETRTFTYTVIANKNIMTNNYPIYANISYLNDESIVRKEYMGVYVDGDSNNNSKPKIIIDEYNFGKEVILAGETFDLDIVFFNTSNTMGIQNAKVSITSEEGAFVPVNAASSFYIESIGVKEKVTHTITLKAKSDLNVKTYNVTADIEYEDSNGNSYDKSDNPYKASEKMAVPVMQELRLEVEDINVPGVAPVFQPFEIYVEFFNMGKSPLQNTMVTTTGDFEVQDGKYFVGTFNAGSNDYYSCQIIPMAEGPQTGVITFEFEDAVGEKHSVTKEFSFEAVPMPEQNMDEFPPMEGSGEFPMPEDESGGIPWLPVSIVLVIVAIVAVVVVKKRIQKKKEMALDE
ncbi:hypothetical protein EZV73_23590 [Acidaminobacter sp. JC074]|uniref:COG1361 S-layer family protein n=1 Tax=Acidaminobacter sp. JC074 TaxID=2530199 RepID=UPI001F104705|nr:hypothetical protein [Acidaminobacter sp. JC074]MCH4890585.1 hypothetical protein [Acidaminobacter sp. JC074]